MSEYENVVVGKLKLKGKALDVKAGGSKKKKKKSRSLSDQAIQTIENEISEGTGTMGEEELNDDSGSKAKGGAHVDSLTPAEKRYMEQRQKIDMQKMAKTANKSHRDRLFNIQVAKAATSAGVPVILDAGGMDAPIPVELLKHVDILSPNESELARLTGMPTESFEQISLAVAECHKLGVKEVLVKLGARGSVLFTEGKEPIRQGIIEAEKVLDTTGAGDTFTAAYAVAFVEGKSKAECLRFAAAAASLCVQVKGAIPSMPRRKAVLDLLQSVSGK